MTMIGNNLKAARKQNKLTQAQVASRLHLSPKTISSWENNHSAPDLESLVNLSVIYQCSADSLLAASDHLQSAEANGLGRERDRRGWVKAAVLGLTLTKISIIILKSARIVVPSQINVLCNMLLLAAVV